MFLLILSQLMMISKHRPGELIRAMGDRYGWLSVGFVMAAAFIFDALLMGGLVKFVFFS